MNLVLFGIALAAGIGAFFLGRRNPRTGALPLGEVVQARLSKRPLILLSLAGIISTSLCLLLASATSVSRSAAGDNLPGSTILVVDVSGSVDTAANERIAKIIHGFKRFPSDRHAGIVFFSSLGFQATPLSSSPADLVRYARFFESWEFRPGIDDQAVDLTGDYGGVTSGMGDLRNPWASAADGGTKISSGLKVARKAFERAGVEEGRVILISDLENAPGDTPATLTELRKLRDAGHDLVVSPLPLIQTLLIPGEAIRYSSPFREVYGDRVIVDDPEFALSSAREVKEPAAPPSESRSALLLSLLLGGLIAVSAMALATLNWNEQL